MGPWGVPDPELVSPSEAAHALGVTRRTVYRWLKSGELDGRKIGGVWRIRVSWR